MTKFFRFFFKFFRFFFSNFSEIKHAFFRTTQTSSIQATDRLMKEIKSIYKSQSFKDGNYTIDIINDNVYEWSVSLLLGFQFKITYIFNLSYRSFFLGQLKIFATFFG